ncbi:CpaF family protein [Spelaeicoccus albus]|uniref:Pilus assembly protein CpaF n=1 Tax=Spelaeicoccus albus TaxID=1280376 RepID=A0A7Z0IJ77_9MICO|nr:ATPase, T2SS/T4P/T4SS family [Spelaeicoccus albus]NYI69260.1 pilus assembly protein CpaF [Spelaeicoccus albus]
MDAISIVEDEVRELVRRRGLDPRHDLDATRALIEDAVADYDERVLSGGLPDLGERDGAISRLVDTVSGFGPLQPYLDDDQIEEIWVNEPGKVFISRSGISELTPTVLTAEMVDELVERMLATSGRRIDVSSPFVDAMLPGGSRLHVVLPGITRRHMSVNIRKFVCRAHTLGDLVATGTVTDEAARFLTGAVRSGLNVVVSGATQAGKTTMLGTLAAAIPARERVISCEEVFELDLSVRDWVAMQCRQPSLEGTGAVPLRTLVTEALRMRPTRVIVGEVRQAETLDLLIALNSGLPGMTSVHANSARTAITKLCTLPLLAGDNVSSRFVVPTVAACVDVVVHMRLDKSGRRRVAEIAAVPGQVEGDAVATETLFVERSGALVKTGGFTAAAERFTAADQEAE